MIAAIVNVYPAIFFLLVKLKIVRFSLFWKVSPAIVLVPLVFGLFIPWLGRAPGGRAGGPQLRADCPQRRRPGDRGASRAQRAAQDR